MDTIPKKLIRFCFLRGYEIYKYLSSYVNILFQKHKKILANYSGELSFHHQKKIALVAIFPSDESIIFTQNLLEGLVANGFYTVIVSTRILAPKQREALLPFCGQVIERYNFGMDFGSYRYGLQWLDKQGLLKEADWLILANDSMYYPKNISNVVKQMLLNKDKWQCLYENFQHYYHAQSFFLLFSKEVFHSECFKRFWQRYIPHNFRVHAINYGEALLTLCLKRGGFFPRAFYSSWNTLSSIKNMTAQETVERMPLSRVLLELHHQLPQVAFTNERLQKLVSRALDNLARGMNSLNPTHFSGLVISHFLHAPLKRDLFFRYKTDIAAILKYAGGFTPEELTMMEIDLRKKGLADTRGYMNRNLFRVGYK